jgi:predicted pyridoxine 5'-phosphate oxidase superfamily flavin-nucleotide-binding protein
MPRPAASSRPVSRYHAGELAVQARAGVTDRAAQLEGAVSNEVPPVAAEFLASQPWIVLGAADADDRMWATVLYGRPGFITTPAPSTVDIARHPLAGDPLEFALTGPVGGLALEPGTRRRMRLNGQAWRTPDGVSIELEEVYSNCPKYIATRHVSGVEPSAGTRHAGASLDAAAKELLARADTAFVATRGPHGGVDASHRGGNPGFLRVVDEHTVEWPDYAGNSMFNTLGNIALDPATGLTVVDPETGTTLYLSGRAEIVWADGGFPSAQRLVRLTVEKAVRIQNAAPLRWELERPARNPPVTVD